MLVWGIGIAARLYYLQVVRNEYYIAKAKDQQEVAVEITPRRGDILDRNGEDLASSVKVDSVFIRPSEGQDLREAARVLSRLTGVKFETLSKKLDQGKSFVWVKRKISQEEREAIERARIPGVDFQKEFRRFYPNREMAAHLLGYVDVDEVGRTGIEAMYESKIHGQPGKVLLLRDAKGRTYQREEGMPEPGATITTTLDRDIQYVVEREVRAAATVTRAAAISVIVMDPHTGAILAMANAPTFNPNEYKQSDSSAWINRSLSLTYEPGSTFKMVTVAAALEEGLTNPNEMIDCLNGSIMLFNRRIRDHNPYGLLSVRQIIQNSSNVGTIRLALRVGEERLAAYIARLGFGEPTDIDLPAEVGGLVRDTAKWQKTSIGSVAIGQEISVTPLQTVSMVASIANGGILYRPYVVQKVDDPGDGVTETKPIGRRVLSEKTAKQIQEMLEDVVRDGTARTSRLEGYRAAGKTGTAQKAIPGQGYTPGKYVASFAGFAPASSPRLAMVVVIDEPKGLYYGGEVAAPVFKRIAEQILQSKAVAPDVPNYAPRYTVTPEKPSKPAPQPNTRPDFRVVDISLPPAGEERPLEAGVFAVPDFSGKSLRQAAGEAGKLGLTPVLTGSGQVVSQNPAPGAHVVRGARIQLRLAPR
jgi:cell division protein FtsI (penicillin-binding protein 3)